MQIKFLLLTTAIYLFSFSGMSQEDSSTAKESFDIRKYMGLSVGGNLYSPGTGLNHNGLESNTSSSYYPSEMTLMLSKKITNSLKLEFGYSFRARITWKLKFLGEKHDLRIILPEFEYTSLQYLAKGVSDNNEYYYMSNADIRINQVVAMPSFGLSYKTTFKKIKVGLGVTYGYTITDTDYSNFNYLVKDQDYPYITRDGWPGLVWTSSLKTTKFSLNPFVEWGRLRGELRYDFSQYKSKNDAYSYTNFTSSLLSIGIQFIIIK